jgi:hypothetical protein
VSRLDLFRLEVDLGATEAMQTPQQVARALRATAYRLERDADRHAEEIEKGVLGAAEHIHDINGNVVGGFHFLRVDKPWKEKNTKSY